ncbi:MAG: DUF1501 domain-containing protein [Rhodospirillaceae bacterium]
MDISRRHFLGSAAGAMVPLAGGVRVAFGQIAAPNILIVIFLRFGMDGLQLLAPADDPGYQDKRGNIGVKPSGFNPGRPLGILDGTQFFLHPQADQLRFMYADKSLAFVHAVGAPTRLRSHFEVQELVDQGSADNEPTTSSGWLTRHLATRNSLNTAGSSTRFIATSDSMLATSALRGAPGVIPANDLESFPISISPERAALLAALSAGNSGVARSTRETLDVVDAIRARGRALPQETQLNYTYGLLSQKLQPLARVLKLDLGIEAATVDFGGWDHHDNLPMWFGIQVRELGDALFAFANDLGPLMQRVTIVAVTEFGRRVEENANMGTDHGAASVMMAMGAGVKGGRIYGQWPGLKEGDLDAGDLAVTTDYRQVLAEVLAKRQGQTDIARIFPHISYKPLGLFT